MIRNILKGVLTFVLAVAAAGVIVLGIRHVKNNVTFELVGDKTVDVRVGGKYEEKGCVAIIFDRAVSDEVTIEGEVDTATTGEYELRYHLPSWGRLFFITRKVNVYDDVPPALELAGDGEMLLRPGDAYEEPGVYAYDNYDGDVTDKVKVTGGVDTSKEGSYTLHYVVWDSSGNESRASRNVTVRREDGIHDYLTDYLKVHGYEVSVGYYNLSSGDEYLYREDKLYYGASLIKTLDAIYLYDKGLVNDERKLYLYNAIYKSSNEAHEFLVDFIGRDKLRNYGMLLGAKYTLSGRDDYGDTTVNDQMVYWKKLYELSKDNEELRSYFINNYGNFLKTGDAPVMHKYGYYGDYYHDAGIVLDEEPYVIVVLTKHGKDDYEKIITDIARLIAEYHDLP